MRASDLIVVVVPFGLVALLIACDRSPTSPVLPGSGTPTGPYTLRLEIGGPASIAPGGTAQLSVIQHLSDGSRRDVTSMAQWRSDNQTVLSVSTSGLASGRSIGEALITAAVARIGNGSREVIVIPDGTYRLSGIVGEADNPTSGIADVRIDATSPGRIADSVTTGVDGRYRLYGVSGETQVRVSKDGYTTHVETITVVDHRTQNFLLTLSRPRPNVSGAYVMTIIASDSCDDQLPDSARRRTYSAAVTQQGSLVEARLSGATFALVRNNKGNYFGGRAEPAGVSFSLTPYDWYYKGYGEPYGDLVEYVDNTFYLIVDGVASLSISGRQLSGHLNGSFQIFNDDPRWGPRPTAKCVATDHQFVMAGR